MTGPTTLVLLALASPQQLPMAPLGAADARATEGFTNIFAVHELADGRVLMTDNLDRAIRIVDFQSGAVRDLGRTGQGPLEYQSAHTILRGTGDTLLVTDNVQRRFVKLVDGEIVGTAPQPEVLRSLRSFSAPLADSRASVYFDVRDLVMGTDGMRERDGAVLRWVPGATTLDTITPLRVVSHAPRANQGYNPFVYRDAWGLAPDGAIALVGTEPYRVVWITDGRRTAGDPIAYERVAIDGDERSAERRAFMSRGRGSMRMVDPPRPGARPDPALVRQIPDDVFPRYKPPFTETRVLVSPASEVWIPRAGAWDAQWTIVDIVGRDGNLRRHVRMPANTRVVGFGRTAVYVAVKDEFDLQRLERIPMPGNP